MPTTTRRPSPDAGSCRRDTEVMAERDYHQGALDRRDCRSRWLATGLALSLVLGWGGSLVAQTAAGAQVPPRGAITAEPSGQAVPFLFFNRPIVVLRARVLGRGPDERANGARQVLDDLVARRIIGPVAWRSF